MNILPPKLFVCDFDGTICEHKFPLIGAPKHGVREALQRIRDKGYRIVIWSCRTSKWFPEFFLDGFLAPLKRKSVKDMKAFLDEHEIPYDEIDDGSRGKPFGDFYCDDKAIRFEDNWEQIAGMVENAA